MTTSEQRISPIVFAVIKEDIRLNRRLEDIAAERDLPVDQVREISETTYYKLYSRAQDARLIEAILEEEASS
jgi:hypothetical protein